MSIQPYPYNHNTVGKIYVIRLDGPFNRRIITNNNSPKKIKNSQEAPECSFLLGAGFREIVAPVPGVEDGKAEGEEHSGEHVDFLRLVDETKL
jgi:hypothetical protein